MGELICFLKEKKKRKKMPAVLKNEDETALIPVFTVQEFIDEICSEVADVLVKMRKREFTASKSEKE